MSFPFQVSKSAPDRATILAVCFLKNLTAEQARAVMERGEFPSDVIDPERYVAVVMTQSWCGQWLLMRQWLQKEARAQSAESGPDIDVFVLEYDREPFFTEFLAFKEGVFGNGYVPYIRFYASGKLVRETNYLSRWAFLRVFGEGDR